MKKYFFVLLSSVFVLVATMAFASQNGQVQPAQGKIKEGAVAPDFSLVGIDGKEVKLSDYKGQYVVLDFWGTWCGWCIKGMPEMKKMYEKYGDKVEIIGIACGETGTPLGKCEGLRPRLRKESCHPLRGSRLSYKIDNLARWNNI